MEQWQGDNAEVYWGTDTCVLGEQRIFGGYTKKIAEASNEYVLTAYY